MNREALLHNKHITDLDEKHLVKVRKLQFRFVGVFTHHVNVNFALAQLH